MVAGDMMPPVAHFYSGDYDGAAPNADVALTTSSFGRESTSPLYHLFSTFTTSLFGRESIHRII